MALFGLFLQLKVTSMPVFNNIWQKSCQGYVTHIYVDHLSQKKYEKDWIFPIPL